MSLEAILEQIRSDGQAQVEQILHMAECDAKAILEKAQQEAGMIYQKAYQEALQPSAGECARLINQAQFEARCSLGRSREDFISTVLNHLYQRLEQARASEEYVRAMRGYLLEVLPAKNMQVPSSEPVRLQADPRDKNLLDEIVREDTPGIDVDYVLQCWGGLIAVTGDGRSRLINTLETRLESAAPVLRKGLADRFEKSLNVPLPAWETRNRQE